MYVERLNFVAHSIAESILWIRPFHELCTEAVQLHEQELRELRRFPQRLHNLKRVSNLKNAASTFMQHPVTFDANSNI
jgi:hypothetical protein